MMLKVFVVNISLLIVLTGQQQISNSLIADVKDFRISINISASPQTISFMHVKGKVNLKCLRLMIPLHAFLNFNIWLWVKTLVPQ